MLLSLLRFSATLFGLFCTAALAVTTANDGDWAAKSVTLRNTSEAALMVRVGDIDNLGYGWANDFDPFSGASTPGHPWPCNDTDSEQNGTDFILLVSSYVYGSSVATDGYTSCTMPGVNRARPIRLAWDTALLPSVNAATLQWKKLD